MDAQKILAFGFKGKLGFIGTWPEVVARNAELIQTQSDYPLLAHMSETPNDFPLKCIPAPVEDPGYAALRIWLSAEYAAYGKYGDFGDLLTVLSVGGCYALVSIAPKAYHKPGVATDVVPILIDYHNRAFFIGIVRGQEPGKGKPALIGGFNNIEGFRFESSPACIGHEGREEAGLKFSFDGLPLRDFTSPFPDSFRVNVEIFRQTRTYEAHRVGIFYTSSEEENPTLGQKRVHCTAGYVLPIRVEGVVMRSTIRRELVPTDKVENNKVFVRPAVEVVDFGIQHHKLVHHAAISKLIELRLGIEWDGPGYDDWYLEEEES